MLLSQAFLTGRDYTPTCRQMMHICREITAQNGQHRPLKTADD